MRITTVGFIALTTSTHLSTPFAVSSEVQLYAEACIGVEVWDVRKNCSGTPYDPMRDVVFFSDPINPSIMLASRPASSGVELFENYCFTSISHPN